MIVEYSVDGFDQLPSGVHSVQVTRFEMGDRVTIYGHVLPVVGPDDPNINHHVDELIDLLARPIFVARMAYAKIQEKYPPTMSLRQGALTTYNHAVAEIDHIVRDWVDRHPRLS